MKLRHGLLGLALLVTTSPAAFAQNLTPTQVMSNCPDLQSAEACLPLTMAYLGTDIRA